MNGNGGEVSSLPDQVRPGIHSFADDSSEIRKGPCARQALSDD